MKVYVLLYDGGVHEEAPEIKGVYTTPELAAHAAKLYGGVVDVLEMLTDVIPEHPQGCYPYEVTINRNGKIFVRLTSIELFEDGDFWIEKGYSVKSGVLQIFAKDEEHAIQIARERLAKRIEIKEWLAGQIGPWPQEGPSEGGNE